MVVPWPISLSIVTVPLLGKPIHHAQTEASVLVHFLGCKEGLKGATAHLLAHAGPRVGDRDHYVIARIQGRKTAAISASDISGRNRQFPPCRHRISRIDREIENG